MLDEPFRENQLIVIEPNPVTPDLQRGFFIGGMNLVTKDGAVWLHEVPLELELEGRDESFRILTESSIIG
jgi:hypothetical protein